MNLREGLSILQNCRQFPDRADHRTASLGEDPFRVHQHRAQPGSLGTQHIGVIIIPNVNRLVRLHAQALQGLLEQLGAGLVGIHLSTRQRELEEVLQP